MFFKNQRIGKYQILDTIGTGGFGSVYLAKDVLIDKRVAIKVPHKQGDDLEKLLREPRLLAALEHPNIVSVITAETSNDVFYIVMEYVDGTSLERYLREHQLVPVSTALDWFIVLGRAIAFAHERDILHRDIRPANVLLSKEGALKLADLGTSRYMEDHPHASTRIGSPPYMAPEHFRGKATFQSDIYSFGVLMYECLTGRLPFFDKDPRRLARMAWENAPVPAEQHNTSIPHDLSLIVSKAMHRLLSSRFQTMEGLLQDLERVGRFQEAPVEASPTAVVPKTEPAFVPNSPSPSPKVKVGSTRDFSRELSDLFCWNCSRPVQRRTHVCPHCNVSLR